MTTTTAMSFREADERVRAFLDGGGVLSEADAPALREALLRVSDELRRIGEWLTPERLEAAKARW